MRKVTVSKHAKLRGYERIGMCSADIKNKARIAFQRGLCPAEMPEELKTYLKTRDMQGRRKVKVYGEHIYVFNKNKRLVTILNLPEGYKT